jgi:hypothetical protein
MRHLDDGQIAELIDAAGRRAGGPADREPEAHLTACAACRERVEEARLTAERARAILGAAVPAVRAGAVAPPFEEILHRAGRGRPMSRRSPLRWLAWAATVVLAGGIGWFARGELPLIDADGAAQSVTIPQETLADELRRLNDSLPVATTPPAPATEQFNRREQQAQEPQEGIAGAGARGRLGEADAARDREGAQSKATEAAGGGAAPPAAPAPLPPARTDDASARLQLRQTPPENERAANVLVAQTRRTDVLDRRLVVTSRETAEEVVGGPVAAVEGVPIQEYYLIEGQQVVQTVQQLANGVLLELDQYRANVPPAAIEPAALPRTFAEQRQRVAADLAAVKAETLVVDGLRIVARAPISADSLRALLRRLRR